MDAGCGSGRVTAKLLDRLPDGRVLCVDASEQMIAVAREALGDRADYKVADLSELEVTEPVDVVFSTATFHWILDHDKLFARMHEAAASRAVGWSPSAVERATSPSTRRRSSPSRRDLSSSTTSRV